MEYFEIMKEEKLTWADILFNSVKGGGCETESLSLYSDRWNLRGAEISIFPQTLLKSFRKTETIVDT